MRGLDLSASLENTCLHVTSYGETEIKPDETIHIRRRLWGGDLPPLRLLCARALGFAAEACSGGILKDRLFGWKERLGHRKPPRLFGEVGRGDLSV